MNEVSSEELLLWIQNNLNKNKGYEDSLYLLIDLLGGMPRSEINALRLNPQKVINLRVDLDLLHDKRNKKLNNDHIVQSDTSSNYDDHSEGNMFNEDLSQDSQSLDEVLDFSSVAPNPPKITLKNERFIPLHIM